MSNQTIQDIAETIDVIIHNQVEFQRKQDLSWKDKYDELVAAIKNGKRVADEWISDAKQMGFTAGLVEAEGYARAINEILTWVDD